MTTEATAQPLEAYREARTAILETVLSAVSGLEGSVLDFEQDHQRRLSAAQTDAAAARAETARCKDLLARQAEAIEAAAAHECPQPSGHAQAAAEPAPAAADEEAEAEIARLRGELTAAEGTIRELRDDLTRATEKAERLEREQSADGAGTEALEAEHAQRLAAITAAFDVRAQENYRAARAAAHTEAAGIVEAIAADNPTLPLSAAAELFAEAFEAFPGAEHDLPAPAAAEAQAEQPDEAEQLLSEEPDEEPGEEPAPVPAAQPVPPVEEFFADPAPAPMTQAMPDLPAEAGAAPFAEEESFFDEEAPAPVPAAGPRPGFALFGRTKEQTPA